MLNQEEVEFDGDGQYSPRAINLEDAPDSPANVKDIEDKPKKQRGASYGLIMDMFEESELKDGPVNYKNQENLSELENLREENRKLKQELQKSRNLQKDLEKEIHLLRSGGNNDELSQAKESKIKLILAAVSEIDRLRSIILLQK